MFFVCSCPPFMTPQPRSQRGARACAARKRRARRTLAARWAQAVSLLFLFSDLLARGIVTGKPKTRLRGLGSLSDSCADGQADVCDRRVGPGPVRGAPAIVQWRGKPGSGKSWPVQALFVNATLAEE